MNTEPTDLTTQISTAKTLPQITAVISAVNSYLLSHSQNHHRQFFSSTFPTLISRLFGFENTTTTTTTNNNSPRGWIDSDPSLNPVLLSFLSPTGPLFNSITAIDRLGLIKYVFPTERLPSWAQFVLSKETGIFNTTNLSPLFKKKVTIHGLSLIELNVFEYFIFWFAYYPVSKINCERSGTVRVEEKSSKRVGVGVGVGNWVGSLPRFSTKRVCEKKVEYGFYTRLLYLYIKEFVPVFETGVLPYRSSLLHYFTDFDSSVGDRAEFFVNTFTQFWLVDNDFSPVNLNLFKPVGAGFNLKAFIGEVPPTPGLGDVVSLFVKYLNLSSVALNDRLNDRTESDICSVGSWNLVVQRPLYRYLLRTFLFCPVESSVTNLSRVFDVWMGYIEPWAIGFSDFKEFEVDNEKTGKSKTDLVFGLREPGGYSASWQGFVLSNYLFYSSLVMHFIGFAHKFLHADPETIVKMVVKVMDVLTSYTELTDLIKNVDTVLHAVPLRSSKSILNSLQRYVPTIKEQLQDWEDGLCESDADGSFLHDKLNTDLRLFCPSDNGGQQLLQLFVLRAESELQALSRDNVNLQCLDSLKKQIRSLFGGSLMKPLSFTFEEKQLQDPRNEIFRPRRIGDGATTDIKYKGDWMKRPISNDEVAWLAKLLVSLSCWLNGVLGLNQDQNADLRRSEGGPGLSYVDVSDDVLSVGGSAELIKVICHAVASFFIAVFRIAIWGMKKYGLRVNLRVLASKKILTVLLVAFGLYLLRRSILKV